MGSPTHLGVDSWVEGDVLAGQGVGSAKCSRCGLLCQGHRRGRGVPRALQTFGLGFGGEEEFYSRENNGPFIDYGGRQEHGGERQGELSPGARDFLSLSVLTFVVMSQGPNLRLQQVLNCQVLLFLQDLSSVTNVARDSGM